MKILLAVSGSIAAYKSYDVLRMLVKNKHQVRVILTTGALKFVKAETFRYLGAEEVYSDQDDFNLSQYRPETKVLHVDLARWGDLLAIAPASANTLAKLSQGSAEGLLASVFLTWSDRPCVLFPAMNSSMYTHSLVQKNIQTLQSLPHVYVYPPQSGELVCGEHGDGKFPTPEAVAQFLEVFTLKKINKKILITTGPTLAPLDTFRFLSNASTGKTGYDLACVALRLGYQVDVVAGGNSIQLFQGILPHPRLNVVSVQTTAQMFEAVIHDLANYDAFIAAAAVCDFEFNPTSSKIKKENFGGFIPAQKATDILEQVIHFRGQHQRPQVIVGFAAESSLDLSVIQEKMQRKPVDLLVANKVNHGLTEDRAPQGFAQADGEYLLVSPQKVDGPMNLTKVELAQVILSRVLTAGVLDEPTHAPH